MNFGKVYRSCIVSIALYLYPRFTPLCSLELCPVHRQDGGDVYPGVQHHHHPAAAHPRQVPLHLQPARPVQGVPGHAHDGTGQDRGTVQVITNSSVEMLNSRK